jgi:CDP-4-dehydro-6-deoxyglucose reductase/ferredoxin-NAD(P)+ reductase (naphthalene dioxygenase ferredoxin-specific)
MPKLTIRQWPLPIETGRGTILDAALENGVPFPHGCRTGECGSCKCLLLSGDVSMKNYDSEVLTRHEKEAGFVLACRSKPRSDVHIAWLGGTVAVELPVRRLTAQVTNVEQVSPTVKRLFLWPEERLQFAAGQFARVKFADLPARAYSMANTPGEEVLEFHVRLIPGGRVSDYIEQRLQIGEQVQIDGPYGTAHLRPEDDGPLVLVAGNSGLAPAKSILRTALSARPERQVHLYFGVRDEAHVYDEGELNLLVSRYKNFRLETVLSEPQGTTTRRTGNLAEIVSSDLAEHRGAEFYMAGPPEMVDAVTREVAAFGIAQERIHADPFHVSGQEAESEAAGGGFNRLLDGMRGLLAIGRLRHPRSATPFTPAEAAAGTAGSGPRLTVAGNGAEPESGTGPDRRRHG